jgi:CMP-N-acetylneuraminic acid synthetase
MRSLAVIPARGGSKGLPGKNLSPLNGIPLLVYSINAALDSGVVDRVCVSTDDSGIADIAVNSGAEIVERPDELATDSALSIDVVKHAIAILSRQIYEPDIVVLLQPTSPLRNADHIREAFSLFQNSGARSLFSVVKCTTHPLKALIVDESGYLCPVGAIEYLDAPRQALPKAYQQNGAIYINRSVDVSGGNTFFAPPCVPFPMESDVSIDIDSAADLELAEELISRRC